jgi:hypothetical protein
MLLNLYLVRRDRVSFGTDDDGGHDCGWPWSVW